MELISVLDVVAVVGQPVVEDPGVNIDVSTGLGSGAFGTFLTTLLVGVLLLAILPEYTERMSQSVTDDPLDSFLYGIISLLGLALVTVLLVITIIGILVAIPLILLGILLWAVGSAITFYAIGKRVYDDEDWKKPLLVGALINGGLALTGVGGIVSFCIGAAGFGAVLRDLLS